MNHEEAAALRRPFPKEAIGKLPKAGMHLDYVGHAAVTDRLLAVDPSWTWEPVAFDEHGLPAIDRFGGLWIRLTVCGVTRLGYGEATGKQPNAMTIKELISDAIRNAAMRFGVALDLWSKEDLPQAAPAHAETISADELQARLGPDFQVVPNEPKWEGKYKPNEVNGSRLVTERQAKAILAIGHTLNLHTSAALCEALTAFLGREITSVDEVFMGEVDRIMSDKGDALLAAVQNRRTPEDDPWSQPANPDTMKHASGKQLAMIRALFAELGMTQEERKDMCRIVADRDVAKVDELSIGEASQLIDKLNALKPGA